MCFTFTDKIPYVENPDVTEMFRIFENGVCSPNTDEDLEEYLRTAAGIFLANACVKAVLESAEKFKNVVVLGGGTTITELPERAVVFCSKLEQRRLDLNVVHPEQLFATSDCRLDDKLVVLQLKDFSFVAQYSFGPSKSVTELEPGCLMANELRIKFNVDADSGIIYERSEIDHRDVYTNT